MIVISKFDETLAGKKSCYKLYLERIVEEGEYGYGKSFCIFELVHNMLFHFQRKYLRY